VVVLILAPLLAPAAVIFVKHLGTMIIFGGELVLDDRGLADLSTVVVATEILGCQTRWRRHLTLVQHVLERSVICCPTNADDMLWGRSCARQSPAPDVCDSAAKCSSIGIQSIGFGCDAIRRSVVGSVGDFNCLR